MFFVLINGAGTLLLAYVAWRAAGLPWVQRRPGRRNAALIAFGTWLLYTAGVQGHHEAGGLQWILAQFALHLLASLFLLALCLLVADLFTGWGPWRRHAPGARAGAFAAGALLVVLALVQGLRPPVVTDYEVRLPRLPAALDGKVVVALSDLHLGPQLGAAWLAARIDQVQTLAPDMVVLLGDQMEAGAAADAESLLPELRRLQAPLGVWAVTGNHELHGDTDPTIALFEKAGIRWLRDRSEAVAPGLVLVGVDDEGYGGAHHPLSSVPVENAAILLSHAPVYAEEAAARGVGLMLSGHTHAGQVWPFGYLVARVHPRLAGRYTLGAMTLVVCRGTGTWGPRMRLWQPGEILRVTLKSVAAS